MSPYSGLVDFFEAKGILKKTGNRLEYKSPVTGNVTAKFRKALSLNEEGILDTIMTEWDKQPEEVKDAMPQEEAPDNLTEGNINES